MKSVTLNFKSGSKSRKQWHMSLQTKNRRGRVFFCMYHSPKQFKIEKCGLASAERLETFILLINLRNARSGLRYVCADYDSFIYYFFN